MLILLLCVALAHAQVQTVTGPRVNTTEGTVEGITVTDGNYYAFYGIHYAGSTSGANRFKAPPPPPTYPGVFSATNNNVLCAQPSARGLIGVEDCLTLSIYTNSLNTSKPVLIFLQGEEYSTITTLPFSYKKLIEEGIVFVTLNYRLSVFGFLCLGVTEAPGNAGLRDVVHGLQWINKNIAGFGGDPNKITLFGHGSAAAMVDLITISPLAVNLVHNALVLSGSALAPWAIAYDPIGYAQAVGAKLGYSGKSNEDLAKLFVGTDINILANALLDFEFYNNTVLFAPCIENVDLNPNDTFLTDAPINLLRAGNYSHIPYIAGYTNGEGSQRAQQAVFNQWLQRMEANFTQFLPVDLDLRTNATSITRSIREFYFQQNTINMNTIEDYLNYHGDTLVLVSVVRGVRERAVTSKAEVRLFEFTYKGTYNSDWAFPTIPIQGAKHGEVLNYLFDYDLKSVDSSAQSALIKRVSAFTRTGSPAVTNYTDWFPVDTLSVTYLYYAGGEGPSANTSVFSESARVNPHQLRMTLWNDLYFKYYKEPTRVSAAGKLFSFGVLVVLSQLIVRFM